MIKTLLLILYPIPTWERIALARCRWMEILTNHLLPLLVVTSLVEGYGLVHWGKPRGATSHLRAFTFPHALAIGIVQLILSAGIVFFVARLIKSFGETFHGRHSFNQSFTVAAYGLSPLFLIRLFDVFPYVSPWATWAVGIVLCAAILYNGLPRVMEPDPPHALGLYLMSVLLLVIVTGLTCFLKAWYLEGKFTRLDALFLGSTGL